VRADNAMRTPFLSTSAIDLIDEPSGTM